MWLVPQRYQKSSPSSFIGLALEARYHRALDDALNIAQLATLILPVLKP